jgi:hypothetical protein
MIRLLRALLFLEFGLMLIVVPWSSYWDRNYFAALIPGMHQLIVNNFVRGAVSGLGVINLFAGVADLVAVYMARHTAARLRAESPHPANEAQ